MSVGIKTLPLLNMLRMRSVPNRNNKNSRLRSRSPDNAEFGHFTLLQRIITHVHSYCSAHSTFRFVAFSLPLPLPSCFG